MLKNIFYYIIGAIISAVIVSCSGIGERLPKYDDADYGYEAYEMDYDYYGFQFVKTHPYNNGGHGFWTLFNKEDLENFNRNFELDEPLSLSFRWKQMYLLSFNRPIDKIIIYPREKIQFFSESPKDSWRVRYCKPIQKETENEEKIYVYRLKKPYIVMDDTVEKDWWGY